MPPQVRHASSSYPRPRKVDADQREPRDDTPERVRGRALTLVLKVAIASSLIKLAAAIAHLPLGDAQTLSNLPLRRALISRSNRGAHLVRHRDKEISATDAMSQTFSCDPTMPVTKQTKPSSPVSEAARVGRI